ncbi:MAG TPA: cation transporter [Solirubrobacteraceae bacterium]|jgi:divalent metal cation (Fe/Co/Zn/Cd) transporter|nr:cation transporter [Solirubrobacteraceae bacterium]
MSASLDLPVIAPGATAAIAGAHGAERERLMRRGRRLAWLGVGWHAVEAAVAVVAGASAGSIALVGFGADSVIEAAAGLVVLWLLSGARRGSPAAERCSQRLVALSFYALAAYVMVEAAYGLAAGDRPDASPLGIGLAALTAATMPPLAVAKGRVAAALGSPATRSESRQNVLCAYLSVALLAGLGGNALAGWWWLDPIVALLIGAVAAREGRESWRGEACGCC